MALNFGMNQTQAAAANAAMSGGTTYNGFHIFIMSLTAFLLVSFVLGCLIAGYSHFAENEIALDKFIKLVLLLAVFFIGVGVFLVV